MKIINWYSHNWDRDITWLPDRSPIESYIIKLLNIIIYVADIEFEFVSL